MRRGRDIALQVVKLSVSVGLLWWLFSGVDLARLGASIRQASWAWLGLALGCYFAMLLVSSWRWGVLLRAQGVSIPTRRLLESFLVATFFNNFLPSNIGGDVVRIRDSAKVLNSRTLATTIVLIDRGLGLLALVLTAALGSTLVRGGLHDSDGIVQPWMLWAGVVGGVVLTSVALMAPRALFRLTAPLRRIHAEWVDRQVHRIADTLSRFRRRPGALATSALGALGVQLILVGFYAATARALHVPIALSHLAVLVPLSFVVQMLPISMNGFGVREVTFVTYFARLHLPAEPALLLSFVGAVLMMVWSLAGAFVHMTRRS